MLFKILADLEKTILDSIFYFLKTTSNENCMGPKKYYLRDLG